MCPLARLPPAWPGSGLLLLVLLLLVLLLLVVLLVLGGHDTEALQDAPRHHAGPVARVKGGDDLLAHEEGVSE
jgi:hypothetical protein